MYCVFMCVHTCVCVIVHAYVCIKVVSSTEVSASAGQKHVLSCEAKT